MPPEPIPQKTSEFFIGQRLKTGPRQTPLFVATRRLMFASNYLI
jgi:hypothetical protein